MNPEERRSFLTVDRPHRASVVEVSVGHDPLDVLRMANVDGRIVVFSDHNEVGELARLQGSEIAIEPNVFGSIQGATTKRFEWRHATLNIAPHFPVGTNAVELTVTTCLDETSLVD